MQWWDGEGVLVGDTVRWHWGCFSRGGHGSGMVVEDVVVEGGVVVGL